jgi:hypothetical protein
MLPHGWIQGRPQSHEGFCLWGAFDSIRSQSPKERRKVNSHAKLQMRRAICDNPKYATQNFTGKSLISWNDDRQRTKEEVIAKLRTVPLL